MITRDDLEAMGFEYYNSDYPEDVQQKARLFNMTPLDMVKEFAKITSQNPTPTLYATLIAEEYQEWKREYWGDHSSFEDQLKEMADLVYVIYGYANSMGWNLDEAVRRVHENNVGRCVQPDGTVKRREDGKIMKNKNFPKVDLGDLV